MFSVQRHSCPANGGDDYVCHLLTDDIYFTDLHWDLCISNKQLFYTKTSLRKYG